jgi:phytanoyl-CoA hydroxylase
VQEAWRVGRVRCQVIESSILVKHYKSAESLLPWFLPPGSTMGRAAHRDVVLVAETDPYPYKGTADVMRPHVRPDGQGGCLR